MRIIGHACLGVFLATSTSMPRIAKIAIFGASLAPDVVLAEQIVSNYLANTALFLDQSPALVQMKTVGHSIPLWIVAGIVVALVGYRLSRDARVWREVGLALALGGSMHIIADAFTHGTGGTDISRYDVSTYFWPMQYDIRPFTGIADFRLNAVFLGTSPYELGVSTILLTFTAIVLITRQRTRHT